MANRKCNGVFFQLTQTRYYRCLWDGSIMKLDWFSEPLKNGSECPNCKRLIHGTDAGTAARFSQVKAYSLEDGSIVMT